MPQDPVLVYEKESGKPVYMHSIDAAEAIRLGDYTVEGPKDGPSPEDKAQALSRMRNINVNPHPELQTPEQRAETRRIANEEAAGGVPSGETLGVRRALGAPERPAVAAETPAASPQRRAGTAAPTESRSS